MRDSIKKLWTEIFKVVGFGFFIGFIMGGVVGLQMIGSTELIMQTILVVLSYASSGGSIGAGFAGCVVIVVAGCTAVTVNKENKEKNNG